MGIHALVYARPEQHNPDVLTELHARLDRCGDWHAVARTDRNGPLVELHMSQRYYGPGYESGNWPVIADTITAFRAVYGHAYYTSDVCQPDEGHETPWTNSDQERTWADWNAARPDDTGPRPA